MRKNSLGGINMNKAIQYERMEVEKLAERINSKMEIVENAAVRDRAMMISLLGEDTQKLVIENMVEELKIEAELLEGKIDNFNQLMKRLKENQDEN